MSGCPHKNSSSLPWAALPPPRLLSKPGLHAPPRIAVCLTGQARTLAHPAVWQSLHAQLLDNGLHDLFAVLGTGGDGTRRDGMTQHHNDDQRLVAPEWLALALRKLGPRRVRLVLDTYKDRTPCKQEDTVQFLAWGECAALVLEAAPAFDWMFRSRPDVFWEVPMPLVKLASHLEPDVVVSSNDHHMLVSRAGLPSIAALRSLTPDLCEAKHGDVCTGHSRVFDVTFDHFNAYCVQASHLARSTPQLRHIETSHPSCSGPGCPCMLTTSPLLRSLSYRTGANQHIVRWAEPQPARQPRGTRIVCRDVPPPACVQCEYCSGGGEPASGVEACPLQAVELRHLSSCHRAADDIDDASAVLLRQLARLSELTLDRPQRRGASYLFMRAPNGSELGLALPTAAKLRRAG